MGTCRRRRRSLTGAVGLTRCTGECVSSSGRGGWLAGGRRGRGTPDTGRWTLDAGCWMLDTEHWSARRTANKVRDVAWADARAGCGLDTQ